MRAFPWLLLGAQQHITHNYQEDLLSQVDVGESGRCPDMGPSETAGAPPKPEHPRHTVHKLLAHDAWHFPITRC